MAVRSKTPKFLGYTGNGREVYTNSPESVRRRLQFVDKSLTFEVAIDEKVKLPEDQARALDTVPSELRKLVGEVARDPLLNRGIIETMKRAADFSSPAAAMIAGVALDERGREYFDTGLDQVWAGAEITNPTKEEVIIGAGMHAAIYCAIRALMGKPKPWVVEQSDRVGGVFAVSRRPSFYLNSRNRPGQLSIPGEMGSLNFMPGAMIQPSELGGAEYQTNDALAWVIRSTLAMYANVIPNSKVSSIGITNRPGQSDSNVRLRLDNKLNPEIWGKRAIIAAGLGAPIDPTALVGKTDRVMLFDQFMRKMDEPYPLKGMNRVAVIGGGDGAKTVIEALTGQGPSRGYSVAALDWPQQIDWYGCPMQNCEDFIATQRSRYKGIGSLLPSAAIPQRRYRVKPMGLVGSDGCSIGYDSILINEVPYDAAVVACGYAENATINGSNVISGTGLLRSITGAFDYAEVNKRRCGYQYSKKVYQVGPGVDIGVSDAEAVILRGISENKTSIFRWAPRTAALAASLD